MSCWWDTIQTFLHFWALYAAAAKQICACERAPLRALTSRGVPARCIGWWTPAFCAVFTARQPEDRGERPRENKLPLCEATTTPARRLCGLAAEPAQPDGDRPGP